MEEDGVGLAMFIDANVFIHALGSNPRSGTCRNFLCRVESGEQHAITSVLVLDEVLYHLLVHGRTAQQGEAALRKICAIPNLQVCPVDSEIFLSSLSFLAQGLDPRDALHAAVMKAHGVSTILSYDKDFDRVKSVKRMEP